MDIKIYKFILLIFMIFVISNNIIEGVDLKTKIALITGGSFNDLGFNAMLNEGRINAQRATEVLHFDLIPNIHVEKFNETVDKLVAKGYNGIAGLAVEVATMVRQNSFKYPEVQFFAFGSLNTTKNLSYATYNIGIMQYMIGYFAGLMTNTSHIGYLAPGLPLVPNYNANALFVGAYKARKDISVHIFNTGDWIVPDISIAATNQLIDKHRIDFLSNNQDDHSASVQMIKRGFFGLGTNGYPQNRIYGEQIAMSIGHNWTQPLIDFYGVVVNKTQPFKFYGEFFNTFLYLDKFGFYVPARVQQKIVEEVKNLSSYARAKHPYFCNDFNRELYNQNNSIFGVNVTLPPSNCITNGQFFKLNSNYKGMFWWGYYEIPLTQVEVRDSILYGFTITAGILIGFALTLLILLGYFRKSHSIRSASPIFSAIIIIGGIMTYIGAIVYALPPTTHTCSGRFWMLAIGYALMVGSLVVKNIRIWMIFDNAELRVVKITNYQLLPWVAGIVSIMILLLALMTAPAVGDIKMVQVDWNSEDGSDLNKYEYQNVCSMSNTASIILYVLLGVFGLLMATGVVVSWKIRTVDIEEFNESKPIANTLYVGLFSIFVILSLMLSPQSTNNETTIICSAVIFITTISLCILFLPKFWRIYLYGSNTSNVFNRGNSAQSAGSRNKTSGGNAGNLTQFNDEEYESRAVAPPTESNLSSSSAPIVNRVDSKATLSIAVSSNGFNDYNSSNSLAFEENTNSSNINNNNNNNDNEENINNDQESNV